MKNNKSLFLLSSSILLLNLCVACGPASSSSTSISSSKKKTSSDEVCLFVLSGQSNMEGSTYWKHPTSQANLLEDYMNEEGLDFSAVQNGIPNVLTTYYGFYYPSGWTNAHTASTDKSSAEARLTPNFQPTTVGMGVGDRDGWFMGPEIGIANTLSEYADEENPIYLAKCAFSGSGFDNGTPNWTSREDDPTKSLFYLQKQYIHKCIEAIEDTGKFPVLKGFLWHQGESDGNNQNYKTRMLDLLNDFKDEFKDYARDGDPDNIAFIDCTIYDGKGTSKTSYGTAANEAKLEIANEDPNDLNFCIDGGFEGNGLKLEIGDDSKGGYNTYHYNTSDCYRLGKAYADIILDNDILDI